MVVSILDGMTLMTTIPGTLFAMLQDRQRTVWPIIMATVPYAVLLELSLVYPDFQNLQKLFQNLQKLHA